MKNKIVTVSVLLASQLITAAAAFASADSDKHIDALLQAPLLQIAQGKADSNPYQTAASSEAVEAPAGLGGRQKRGKHTGGKRKHGSRGRFKRRLSSRQSTDAAQAVGNSCCTAPASGM